MSRNGLEAGTHSVMSLILDYLSLADVVPSTDVASAILTSRGRRITRDPTLGQTLLLSRIKKETATSKHDFRGEWAKSIGAPIREIGARMSKLKTGDHNVVVADRVPREDIVGLYDELKAIDPNFNKESMLKSDMVKMKNMSKYWDKHAVATPYSFDLRKCNNEDCCGVIRTPMEVRDLVMQRTPTPRHDPLRVGHFKRREQLLSSANTNPNAMTDLTDLPSMKEDKNKEDTKERTNRDLLVSQAAGVRSWEFKKVKGFVVCYHCGKRRCIYSNNDKAGLEISKWGLSNTYKYK